MGSKKKNLVIMLALVALLVVVGATCAVLFRRGVAVAPGPKDLESTASIFEFMGADGWYQGPSNATSMALFSDANADGISSCFTSAEYYPGTVDVVAQLQKNTQHLSGSGYQVLSLGAKSLTIQTSAGDKQFVLHQSKVVASEQAGKIMSGNALGFLQLSNGYLKIYGNCRSADELSSIFPALESYKLHKSD